MNELTIFAYGFSSSRSYSGGYRSYGSTRSYSSTRSTSTKSYTSTRTRTTTKSSGYTSTTRTRTSSRSSYHSSRPASASRTTITRSNLYRVTTPAYRTTVYHTYYADHYWYNGMFFHPFGMGYGCGDFWFWMWLFDRPQYTQQQQVIQASPTAQVTPQSNVWGIVGGVGLVLVLAVACWGMVHWVRKHLAYMR